MAYQIQLLGLRPYFNQKKQKMDLAETFHANNWRADSEEQIFQETLKLVAQIPEKERWNMYWTVARCHPDRGRHLAEQWLIPFDIDYVAPEAKTDAEYEKAALRAAHVALNALGVDPNKVPIISSGHGVQFFIKLQTPILSEDYFDTTRLHYAGHLHKIKKAFIDKGLLLPDEKGKLLVDSSVFSAARLMRLPMTENRKDGRVTRTAKVLQSNMEAVDFDVTKNSGVEDLPKDAAIPQEILRRYPTPDTKAILSGCGFIKWCFEKPNDVREYQWYAAISITARLEEGDKISHQMSEGYKGYSSYETDVKIEQALNAAGPRTCKNIESMWDGCKACPHYQNIASPILITGPDYIKTKDTGFRKTWMGDDGKLKVGKPEYGDLIKQFEKDYSFVTLKETEGINIFNGKHWLPMDEIEVKAWMNELVDPEPSASEMSEFSARLKARNLKGLDWLDKTTERKMNFQNGVLDLNTMVLSAHSPEYGFTNVLPYPYTPGATAPIWEKYLKDVSAGDEKLMNLLEQFGGYAIAGGQCFAQKALVLLGKGGNGKSVYPETLAEVVGKGNYSALMLQHLNSDQMRYLLVNKLFNYGDESPRSMTTEMIKSLVTGADMTVKKVYETPFIIRNKAKFIILANELPRTTDLTDGFYDRLLIANFDVRFRGTANDDKMLKYKMWENELPGICNRLIEAYKKLVQNNYIFDEPDKSKEVHEMYREEENNVLRFAKDNLVLTQNSADCVPMPEIYSAYVSQCMFEQEKPHSKVIFFKILRDINGFANCKTKVIRDGNKVQKSLTNVRMETEGEF